MENRFIEVASESEGKTLVNVSNIAFVHFDKVAKRTAIYFNFQGHRSYPHSIQILETLEELEQLLRKG
jgi:hypothetical protein